MAGGTELFVWVVAVFALVAVVSWALSILVTRDSLRYDEEHTWHRSVEEEIR